MGTFKLTISAKNLEDALDLYGRILSTHCQQPVDAQLDIEINNEVKLLSKDYVHATGPQIYLVQ